MEEIHIPNSLEDIIIKGKQQEAYEKLELAQMVFYAIALLSLLSAVVAFYWAWESTAQNMLAYFIKRSLHLLGTFAGVTAVIFFVFGLFFPIRPRVILVLAFLFLMLRMWFVWQLNNYVFKVDFGWVLNVFFLCGLIYASIAYFNFKRKLPT